MQKQKQNLSRTDARGTANVELIGSTRACVTNLCRCC